MIEVTYKVTVQIDGNVWMDNYGEDDPVQVIQDVRGTMRDVVEELASDYISKTGNVGTVKVRAQ
jgi:hypothetical protein